MSDNYDPKEYTEYRIDRARETIKEVETHIENKFWNTSINRMYYACFYAVIAILNERKVTTSSHSGARQKFGQLFVVNGEIDRVLAKMYNELFDKRHKGDYNDFFDNDEETVKRLFPLAKRFIERIEELLRK